MIRLAVISNPKLYTKPTTWASRQDATSLAINPLRLQSSKHSEAQKKLSSTKLRQVELTQLRLLGQLEALSASAFSSLSVSRACGASAILRLNSWVRKS